METIVSENRERDITTIYGSNLTITELKLMVLKDYKLAYLSRQISLICRREVLSGKAKFGILGDGKELPQIALSKVFKEGDFRSGYYRDQTLMLALENVTPLQLYSQLYANPDPDLEPHSAGRQMNAHFATHSLDRQGHWQQLTKIKNTASDISCTAGQMPRAIGLSLASKLYRKNPALDKDRQFSNNGNEITFVTIGDASTSEGHFWEAINAAGVLKTPMIVSIWDDGYGISVPTEYQTTKGNISEVLEGFRLNEKGDGYLMYRVKAWDYPELLRVYREVSTRVREEHIPAIVHVQEVTQPQGHSTSGSHERYKDAERLQWEKDWDCLTKMREWILKENIAGEEELEIIEKEALKAARKAKKEAWLAFTQPTTNYIQELENLVQAVLQTATSDQKGLIDKLLQKLKNKINPTNKDAYKIARRILYVLRNDKSNAKFQLLNWKNRFQLTYEEIYHSYVYSQSDLSPMRVKANPPIYDENSPILNGFQVLNYCFDAALEREPRLVAFGEDVGTIGDVNQGFAQLQEKYGEDRVSDTGIRELTIMGQGIGLAMRGFRPIVEIQYLDYFIYGFQPIVDDLATLHYRTNGRQKAPLIIRTRGHRLEGIWHTGSPIAMILNGVRGVHVLVPRDMTRAAAFYNTLLQSDDPAIVIECLNGYRLKEKLPNNVDTMTIPLGVPETLRTGTDVTIVTYGSCCRIADEACDLLAEMGISVELIDVQSLLPFDIHHDIVKSLAKTNRIVFLDEDVPGGASAFMMQQVLEVQGGYYHLDSKAVTITASEHRSPFGSDGDYFSKPSVEDVVEGVYDLMHELDPEAYPAFW